MSETRTEASQPAALGHTFIIFVAVLSVLIAIGAIASASAQIKRHSRHGSLDDLSPEMQASVTLVEAQLNAKAKRANIARNGTRTYEAFTLDVPIEGAAGKVRNVVFVEDMRQGKVYEVRGFDFPRPFTDLAWRGHSTLVFDQWMQPNYAWHYEINVRQGKLVAASSFWERGFAP